MSSVEHTAEERNSTPPKDNSEVGLYSPQRHTEGPRASTDRTAPISRAGFSQKQYDGTVQPRLCTLG